MNAARSSRPTLRAQSRLCSTGSKDPRATPAGVSVHSSLDHTASEPCGFASSRRLPIRGKDSTSGNGRLLLSHLRLERQHALSLALGQRIDLLGRELQHLHQECL